MTDNCWVVFERDGRGDSIIAVCTEKREADAIKRQNEQDRYIVGANLISSRDKRLAEAADYYSPYREGQRKDKKAARELINETRFNLHHPPTDKCGYCDQARKSLDSAFSVVSTAYMNQIRLLKSLSNTQTEPEESR